MKDIRRAFKQISRPLLQLAFIAALFWTPGCGGIETTVDIAPPGSLKAKAGNKSVSLSWERAEAADAYVVFWNTAGGVSTSSNPLPTDSITYTHRNLTNHTTYHYRVASVSEDGQIGTLSDEVSATPKPTIPETPKNVTATGGPGQVTLKWSAAQAATSYKIYWSLAPGVSETSRQKTATTTTYTHTGLKAGTTYYYRVAGVNTVGVSALSEEVSATPTAGGGGTGCPGAHTPPSGMTVAKSIARCSTASKQQITTEMNGINLSYGAFTGRMIGVGDVNPPTIALFFLMHGRGANGNKENINQGMWGGNPKSVRATHHYWNPNLRAPKTQFRFSFFPNVEYTWSCTWNPKTFSCNIAGSDGSNSGTYNLKWGEPFVRFESQGFLFGNRIYGGDAVGKNAVVTGMRYTVFK